jgi:hypothetical protein
MTLAAGFLGGASGRLLPASIPFRFFAAAAIFHVAMWAVLLASVEQVIRFRGGMVPAISAVHLLVLGVLATTAVGSAAQLLPVATRRALAAYWPIRLLFWMLVPGIVALSASMFVTNMRVLAAAALLTGLALLLFAILLADNLRRAANLPAVAAFGWAAVASLTATAVLGPALSVDYVQTVLEEHASLARAHAVLAAYGFMGMLALGFSHVLIPMFALSPSPSRGMSIAGFVTAAGAIAIAVLGLVFQVSQLVVAGSLIGLVAISIHIRLMLQALRSGMRKRLGLSFWLVRASWIALPASVLAGVAAYFGHAGPNGPALFGLILLVGWLLTFLLGILQRIMPFLATMHAPSSRPGAPARMSELASDLSLKIHAVCHAAAFALLCLAVVIDRSAPALAAGWIGLAGSLAFALFTTSVIRGLLPVAIPGPASTQEDQ